MRLGATKAAAVVLAVISVAAPLNAQKAATLPKLEVHGLVQVWALGEDTASTFRIRRTELRLTGSFSEKLRWQVQVDPVRATNVLQDAMLSYVLRSDLTLDVGQYKVPFTREGTMSSAQLETVERALFSAGPGKVADIRDIGAQIRYAAPWSTELRAGVFNSLGGNDNALDRDDRKALMGQLTVSPPFVPGMTLTTSGGVTVGDADSARTSNRFSAGIMYGGHGWIARGEYVSGEETGTLRRGGYGLLAYRVLPRLELAGRFDVWNPNARNGSGNGKGETDYVGGFTYFVDDHLAKVQVNYMRKTFDDSAVSARNVFIINAQAAW